MLYGFTVVMIILTESNIYNELYDYLMSSNFMSYKTRYLLYEKAVWHTQQRRCEEVYNHPGTGGTRSSWPCWIGYQNMGTQSIPNIHLILMQTNIMCGLSQLQQTSRHTHKHRDEILTGIEFRRQADDYYWSPCEYKFKV